MQTSLLPFGQVNFPLCQDGLAHVETPSIPRLSSTPGGRCVAQLGLRQLSGI